MNVLFETPAGYALMKVTDKGKLEKVEDIHKHFATAEKAQETVKLKAFSKFEDTTAALSAATAVCDQKLDKNLKKFLKSAFVEKGLKGKLAVHDKVMGNLIKEKLGIKCIFDASVVELMRGIRTHIDTLLNVSAADNKAMKLGLSHSLCRYKLKFSPDKVDVMIIQAISLLDELDKELNTYSMRVREWYGWHFPEMGKIVTDNQQFAKVVRKMGVRTNAAETDLSDILDEETEESLKTTSQVSMGTEIAESDLANIQSLCDQVIEIHSYRSSLFEYLRNRMNAIAPNLSVMVGELVGARLIAHAGSLMNLAKQPASTVQILGAEKALFRALKTKHDTPKYGLIYHASLVGQANPKHKGRISRVLAAKTALSIRTDALGDVDGVTVGFANREKVENRLRILEGGVSALSGQSKRIKAEEKYSQPSSISSYNASADVAMEDEKSQKKKKKKSKKEGEVKEEVAEASPEKKKKKKKRKLEETEETDKSAKKKKKKKAKTEA
jgi:nucleolar protein 58